MKRKKVDIKCTMSDYAAIINYKIGKKNLSNKKIINSKKYLIDKIETEVTGIEFQSLICQILKYFVITFLCYCIIIRLTDTSDQTTTDK